jgi:hypothetical protein
MAKLPHQPRSRKRRQNPPVAATSLRRSVRIAHRTIFRFNDLAPELRNAVYTLVLESDDELKLVDRLPPSARALSQVSRTVRAESLGIYYSVNDFNACLHYWSTRNAAQQKVRHIENWYTLFGKLAAPNIRTLTMCHMSLFTMGNDTYFMTFPMIRRITIFTHGDEFFDQLRASFVARISRQSNHFRWALDRSDPKFDMWPIGMFQALGDLRLEPEALRLLLTGLQLVIPCTTTSDESLIAAALLSQLESE